MAEGRDHPLSPALRGAEIDEKHLVFVVFDDLAERVAAAGEIYGGKLALEDRVLEMVAKIPHCFEDFAQPLVIADVVADEKCVAHGDPPSLQLPPYPLEAILIAGGISANARRLAPLPLLAIMGSSAEKRGVCRRLVSQSNPTNSFSSLVSPPHLAGLCQPSLGNIAMATIASRDATGPLEPFALPISWSLADLQRHLGDIPANRVRLFPHPGTGTAEDAEAAQHAGSIFCELVDGVLVEKPMGALESLLALEVAFALRTYLEGHRLGVVLGADGLLQPGPQSVRGPDVSFIRWERFPDGRLPADRIWTVAPDLAVEVLSPGNTVAEMERKVADYLGAGTRLVWIIEPISRTAVVHAANDFGVATQTFAGPEGVLDGGEVLPKFRLELSRVFRGVNA